MPLECFLLVPVLVVVVLEDPRSGSGLRFLSELSLILESFSLLKLAISLFSRLSVSQFFQQESRSPRLTQTCRSHCPQYPFLHSVREVQSLSICSPSPSLDLLTSHPLGDCTYLEFMVYRSFTMRMAPQSFLCLMHLDLVPIHAGQYFRLE